jgi:hypothetical protein
MRGVVGGVKEFLTCWNAMNWTEIIVRHVRSSGALLALCLEAQSVADLKAINIRNA